MNFYKALIFSMSLMLTINGYAGIDEEPFDPLTITKYNTGLAFTGNIFLQTPCVPETLSEICSAIKNCDSPKSVTFNDIDFSTSISPNAFESVCGVLSQKDTIKKLKIYNAGIGTEGIDYLLPVLKNNTKINSLNLNYNSISSKKALEIIKCTNIPTLELSGNKICLAGAAEVINLFSTTQKKTNKTPVLYLLENPAKSQEVYNELENNKKSRGSIQSIKKIGENIQIINADNQEIRVFLSK